MSNLDLVFRHAQGIKDIENTYNYNLEVFTGSLEFEWSLEGLKQKVEQGWELYSVQSGKNIVAAVLVKLEKSNLYTLSTPIRLDFQGQGYSHMLKDFFEKEAKSRGAGKILSYCHSQNFRLISLNETHGYTRTGRTAADVDALTANSEVLEWEKML